jgi:hypothetical protein
VTIDGQATDGSRSGFQSTASGGGRGGDIDVSAATLTMNEAGLVTAESTGTGDAGNIDVTATDLHMYRAAISTEAIQADGGNIKVNVTGTVLLHESAITAAVGGGLGNGGNVTIDPEFVILDNSQVLASAIGGNGGNITVVTDHFIGSSDSVLDASSQLGIDGTVNIITPDEDIDSNLVDLPSAYQDAAGLLREPCSSRHFADRSSFTVSGRSGLPAAPDSPYSLLSSLSDLQATHGETLSPQAKSGAYRIEGQSTWLAATLSAQSHGCTL